jgi:hypothetical protein
MNGLNQALQSIVQTIFMDAELKVSGLAIFPDIGMTRDDQTHLALGQAAIDLYEPRRASPILCGHAFPGGGADKTVCQLHSVDFRCLKKLWHLNDLFSFAGTRVTAHGPRGKASLILAVP